jgi:hypothetical protein
MPPRDAGATVSPGVERGSAVTHRDVMLQFCSLGDNCDFAAAQRAYQAEPLDLFRWARTPFVSLIRLLDNDFNGLADIKVTRLQSDYRVVCEKYNFVWHAWTNPEKHSAEDVARRETARLPFLARKFREEMADGGRIFIIKREVDLHEMNARKLRMAMDRHGPAPLVYVTQGSPVSATRVADHLFHATMPKFAERRAVMKTSPAADWLALCRACLEVIAPQSVP